MSGVSTLHDLVTAISNSVIKAQEKIEAAQLDGLMSYFRRKEGKSGFFPINMKINLPSVKPGAAPGSTEVYRAPYLAVLPYNTLRIKKVDVSFDIAFNALSAETKADSKNTDENTSERRSEELPSLSIDMGGSKNGGGFSAHVLLSMEGMELPEGTSRLISELIKTSQTYDSPPEDTPPAALTDAG